MKKVIVVLAIAASLIAVASCKNCCKKAAEAEATEVCDSTKCACDSCACDTCACHDTAVVAE